MPMALFISMSGAYAAVVRSERLGVIPGGAMAKDSPDEVVFAVAGSTAKAAERISLAEAGLREREHLQEWVIAHPEIIGPDVMIVTFEFDHWSSAAGAQKDRLDVLGLGQDGRIVVAELKRGRAPDMVDMQALKYAAMASRFKPALLAEYHSRFTRRDEQQGDRQPPLTEAEALTRLETHSDVGLLPDKLINPRVVLLAESFPPQRDRHRRVAERARDRPDAHALPGIPDRARSHHPDCLPAVSRSRGSRFRSRPAHQRQVSHRSYGHT